MVLLTGLVCSRAGIPHSPLLHRHTLLHHLLPPLPLCPSFLPESNWGANAGLAVARDLLEPVKQKVSTGDNDTYWMQTCLRAQRVAEAATEPTHPSTPPSPPQSPWISYSILLCPACMPCILLFTPPIHPSTPPPPLSSPGSPTPTCGPWRAPPPSRPWAVSCVFSCLCSGGAV